MSIALHDFMRTTVENLPHCKKLGLKFDNLEQGKGRMRLSPRPELICNPAKNLLHSAIVTTLLDTLCGTVASSIYPEGRTVATLDLRLDHLTPACADSPLYAEAECFHFDDDIAFVRGFAWQGEEQRQLTTALGSFKTNGHFQLQAGEEQ
ncbi:PaaI family thioesterase [Terasakiella sp. SH-1]|uniref:PaaI family thioesterase n=1 Tax=Terasakiella sp. SH-1 TaxID=2560057 RepID=UPI00142FF3E1|nr:PaaI family thioesterase [Terasakiella sp. SH-1]